jgi:hypothetical protein
MNNELGRMRFQVLMAISMKLAVFWVVSPCSLVEVYKHFRGACCLVIVLMMEALSTFGILVNFYQTTWCNNPEDGHLQLERGVENVRLMLLYPGLKLGLGQVATCYEETKNGYFGVYYEHMLLLSVARWCVHVLFTSFND